jgi:hypothetical protein
MISKSLTRRLEHLESRFESADEPVGEPTIIDMSFVDKDGRVVGQMQMTVPSYPNNSPRRGRRVRYQLHNDADRSRKVTRRLRG